VFDAPVEVRSVLPSDWYDELTLNARQRAIVLRDGRPVRFLRPGTHRYWTIDPSVEVRVLDVDEPVPELTDEHRAIVPTNELVDVTILHHQRGLKYVGGRFVELLAPGRHLMWSHADAKIHVAVIDTRLQQVTLPGQDILTRDKVTVRLTLTVEYAPVDLPIAAHVAVDLKESLYLDVQLAARDYVASVSLDELLERRDGLTNALAARLTARGKDLGVSVTRVGVKDIILPGEMRTILNRVIEAEKTAAANVITRREEAAAMRAMANVARTLAENPLLLELKRLETLEKVAANVDEVRLVVGKDGLAGLLPSKGADA
jgi:regulator of protease activity HflC (stomatin/prohibitin superfamily)